MIQFVTAGGQTTRTETFEHIFVPTLLAASGRGAEALAALSNYERRNASGTREEEDYSTFRDRLSGWLG